MHAAGTVFLIDGGTHAPRHFDSAHDKLHLLGYDTTHALPSTRAAGGATVLNLGDGTTIKVQNILHLNAKDFG